MFRSAIIFYDIRPSIHVQCYPRKALSVNLRYGNEIRELFGIEPKALTAAEAGYLIGFRNADTLRDRAAKAREERRSRLLSKGIGTSKVTPQYSTSPNAAPWQLKDVREIFKRQEVVRRRQRYDRPAVT